MLFAFLVLFFLQSSLRSVHSFGLTIPGLGIEVTLPDVEDLIGDLALPEEYNALLEQLAGVANELLPGISISASEVYVPEEYVNELNDFFAGLATINGNTTGAIVVPTSPEELANFTFPEGLGLGSDFRLPTTTAGWENFTWPEGAFADLGGIVPPVFSVESFMLCKFCDEGPIESPENFFGGLQCSDWEKISNVALGEQCTLLRAGAVRYCGCPTTKTETCSLCPDGSEDVDQDLSVTVVDFQCKDITNSIVAVDGDRTCDTLSKYAYVCRCPGVVPSCTLCDNDETLSNPSNLLLSTDLTATDGILGETSCQEYDRVLSTVLPVHATATKCQEQVLAAQDAIGFDIRSYCGCPTTGTPAEAAPAEPTPAAGRPVVRHKHRCCQFSAASSKQQWCPVACSNEWCRVVASSAHRG